MEKKTSMLAVLFPSSPLFAWPYFLTFLVVSFLLWIPWPSCLAAGLCGCADWGGGGWEGGRGVGPHGGADESEGEPLMNLLTALTLSAWPTLSLVFWPKSNATGLVFCPPISSLSSASLSPAAAHAPSIFSCLSLSYYSPKIAVIHKILARGAWGKTHRLPPANTIIPSTPPNSIISERSLSEQQIVSNLKSLAITGANIPLIKEVKWREC